MDVFMIRYYTELPMDVAKFGIEISYDKLKQGKKAIVFTYSYYFYSASVVFSKHNNKIIWPPKIEIGDEDVIIVPNSIDEADIWKILERLRR